MSTLSYMEMREEMCITAKNIWDRRLTNAAGGNFAVRVDDNRILITPSLMSERKHCCLKPEDILLIDYEENILEGEGKLSRESDMHILMLSCFENIRSTIHAHPFHCMPYIAFGKPIQNVTEATMGRGVVEVIPYTKAYTPELAQKVYEYFDARRELAERKPLGVIQEKHGIVVTGPDLYMAYSMLERIEADAYCGIAKSLI